MRSGSPKSIFLRPPTLTFSRSAKKHYSAIALNDGPQAAGIPAVQVWQTSRSCLPLPWRTTLWSVARDRTPMTTCAKKGCKSTGEVEQPIGRAFSVQFHFLWFLELSSTPLLNNCSACKLIPGTGEHASRPNLNRSIFQPFLRLIHTTSRPSALRSSEAGSAASRTGQPTPLQMILPRARAPCPKPVRGTDPRAGCSFSCIPVFFIAAPDGLVSEFGTFLTLR